VPIFTGMKYIVSLTFLCTSLFLSAQNLIWDTAFNHNLGDAQGKSVKQLASGSIFFLGYGEDSLGNKDFILNKLDAAGNIIWWKNYGDAFTNKGNYISLTADGNLIMIGEWINNLSVDYTIMKVDTNGNLLWSYTYGDTTDTEALKYIQQTTDGGYVACGFASVLAQQSNDFLVVKFDSLGAVEWANKYGTPGNDYAQLMRQTPDGGYIISGDSRLGDVDNYVLKLDSAGNEQWHLDIGDGEDNGNQTIIIDEDGTYLLAGESTSPINNLFDLYFVKVSTDGGLIWSKYVGGVGADAGFSLLQKGDNYFVCGYSTGGAGDNDFFLLKCDSNVNPIGVKYFLQPGASIAYDMVEDLNGNFLLGGISGFNFYIVNAGDGAYTTNFNMHDEVLDLPAIQNLYTKTYLFRDGQCNYYVKIADDAFAKDAEYSGAVYSLNGQLLFKGSFSGNSMKIPGDLLSSTGVYLWRAFQGELPIGQGKFAGVK
jgi:hypothetical protein